MSKKQTPEMIADAMPWPYRTALRNLIVQPRYWYPSGRQGRAIYGMSRRRHPLVEQTCKGHQPTALGKEVYACLRAKRPDLFPEAN